MLDSNKIINEQRDFFNSGCSKDINFRIKYLKKLLNTINLYQDEILFALNKDLSKSSFEAYEAEVSLVIMELNYMIKNLKNLSKGHRVKTPLVHFPSRSKIYKEPYGVTLIISPWNYPFQLAMIPLIGSVAAGNCVLLKPSEYSVYTSEIISKIIKETFNENHVTTVIGDSIFSQKLLDNKFDYIFFTGSPSVGRIVMKKAAEHLTPTTLELGGKSPCIVDETADVKLASKRIIWGKLLNAGQTCVAPDYILIHKTKKEELIKYLKQYITEFYGSSPENNLDYPKIINKKHFDRLLNIIQSETNVYGGNANYENLKIAPAIIANANWNSFVMKEEIFGPIIPIIEFDSINSIITEVNNREKPLALYLFTTSKENENLITKNISFGGGCINDTIIHLANHNLPFGGVGGSGMGNYHGKYSFDTFSHTKSILKKSNFIDIPLRYPPFKNLNLLKAAFKYLK